MNALVSARFLTFTHLSDALACALSLRVFTENKITILRNNDGDKPDLT